MLEAWFYFACVVFFAGSGACFQQGRKTAASRTAVSVPTALVYSNRGSESEALWSTKQVLAVWSHYRQSHMLRASAQAGNRLSLRSQDALKAKDPPSSKRLSSKPQKHQLKLNPHQWKFYQTEGISPNTMIRIIMEETSLKTLKLTKCTASICSNFLVLSWL